MDEALRVGILGVGFGEVHARAFREVPGVVLAAACSRRPEKVAAFAAAHGIPRTFTDAGALIASGCVDLVVVATPNQEHHPMTMAALEAGLHVLCEKPLAMDAAQAREMVAAARSRGRVLALHLNRRLQPAILAMRRAFDQGQLGAVRFVRTTWHRQRGIPAREGFLTRARAGGGCLIDLGVHMLDQALWVQGYPRVERVSARLFRDHLEEDVPGLGADVEDMAVGMLHLEGGGVIELEISWAACHHQPEERVLQVYGTRGGARRVVLGDAEEDQASSLHGREGAAGEGRLAGEAPTVQADMVVALREGREPWCTGEQGLRLMEALDALYESSRLRREVRLASVYSRDREVVRRDT